MAEKAAQISSDLLRQVEKSILLQTVDHHWREHLLHLDHLRQTIGLRGYGQRDPLNEYKTEAFSLFESLLNRLRQDVTRQLMGIQPIPADEAPLIEDVPVREMHEEHADPQTGENEMAEEEAAGQTTVLSRAPSSAGIDPTRPETWGKVSRNALCPCGSGKKYKHCHGAVA